MSMKVNEICERPWTSMKAEGLAVLHSRQYDSVLRDSSIPPARYLFIFGVVFCVFLKMFFVLFIVNLYVDVCAACSVRYICELTRGHMLYFVRCFVWILYLRQCSASISFPSCLLRIICYAILHYIYRYYLSCLRLWRDDAALAIFAEKGRDS